jgi:hypothetical protein
MADDPPPPPLAALPERFDLLAVVDEARPAVAPNRFVSSGRKLPPPLPPLELSSPLLPLPATLNTSLANASEDVSVAAGRSLSPSPSPPLVLDCNVSAKLSSASVQSPGGVSTTPPVGLLSPPPRPPPPRSIPSSLLKDPLSGRTPLASASSDAPSSTVHPTFTKRPTDISEAALAAARAHTDLETASLLSTLASGKIFCEGLGADVADGNPLSRWFEKVSLPSVCQLSWVWG